MSKEEQYTIQPTHITLPHSDYIDLQYKANAYDQIISVDNKAMNDLTTILAIFVEEGYDVGDGTIIYDMVHFRDTKAFHRYEKYAENLKNYILKTADYDKIKQELAELKEKYQHIHIGLDVNMKDGVGLTLAQLKGTDIYILYSNSFSNGKELYLSLDELIEKLEKSGYIKGSKGSE